MLTRLRLAWILTVSSVACSSAAGGSFGAKASDSGAAGIGGNLLAMDGGGGSIDPPCMGSDPNADQDSDGYLAGVDCNDCSPVMNPGAFDFPHNNIDEDCSGTPDDEPADCDKGLALDDADAFTAALALGLCRVAQSGASGRDRTWGVIQARYVFPDGTTSSQKPAPTGDCMGQGGPGAPPNDLSHGLLSEFGQSVKPRDGDTMLVLSSGAARSGVVGSSPGGGKMCTRSGVPDEFHSPPKPNCLIPVLDTPTANDPIALELTIRAPTNAKSLSYEFDFYTYEYPDWICSQYNDFFVTQLNSRHPSIPENKNISFDSQKNPVSVNNGFLEICKPELAGGKQFDCRLGTAELKGTGFDGHGATGWLRTVSAIVPGEEFTIRFAIWDAGDEALDSTVLIDNFCFDVTEGEVQTLRPPAK